MTALLTGNNRAPLRERCNDLYETPPCATRALLKVEPLPHRIWEPACGRGAIVNVLRAAGHEVVATDLVDYGIPITPPDYYRIDFLMERRAPEGTQAIFTNPPFKLAEQFVAHALELCPRVIMLLRLNYLAGRRRSGIMDSATLERVYVFRKRLPMMHREGWDGRKAAPRLELAWFCWNRNHNAAPTIHRISWSTL